jgi:hypothetical protein
VVTFEPPTDPDWSYVLETVLPRLGMWTGRATYERAVCFVEGFDLAQGSRVHPLMTSWAQAQYGETNIGWPWVLVRIVLGTSRDTLEGRDLDALSPEEDAAALALLHEALREAVKAL